MDDNRLNPQVTQSIADMDGVRIQDHAVSNFTRHFWSANKRGHYRFGLVGGAILAPIGLAIGLAVTAFIGLPVAAAIPILAAFTAGAGLMGVESFGATGSAAAARASGLAEKHARMLDAEAHGKGRLNALDDKLLTSGHGHHYEFPPDRDAGKIFAVRSGVTGAALGAVSGAVAGIGTMAAGETLSIPLIGQIAGVASHMAGTATLSHALVSIGAASTMAAAAPLAAAAIAGALVFGAFGLYFGVERHISKSILNQTDANLRGELTFKEGADIGKAQLNEAGISDPEILQLRLRRQAEIDRLENEYNDRICWGALNGRFRGFPGAAIGVLTGLAAGAVISVATAGLLPAAIVLASTVTAGGLIGMNVFSEAGMEAGAEATARGIDEEFERNRILRAKGITPPTPRQAQGRWVIPSAALIAGVLGAAVGVALAPVVGVGILAMAGAGTTAAGYSLAAIEVSALTCGLIGATYGIGNNTLKAMAKPFTWAYDKVSFRHTGDIQPDILPSVTVQTPAHEKISAQEAAALSARLDTAGEKNFVHTVTVQQQLMPSAGMTTGV